MQPPRLAITMGDPAGIGPEIILKALAALRPRLDAGELRLVVVGSRPCFDAASATLGLAPGWHDFRDGAHAPLTFCEVGDAQTSAAPIVAGRIDARAGELAFRAVARSVELAMAGAIDAMVTAPLNKEAMNLAGHRFAGHTDLLADLTGSRDSVMMLAHGDMRVSHVSTHVALAEVPSRLTSHRIRRVVELTHEALRTLGLAHPRIAVAALNPHGGEGGMFGTEDIDVTAPAVAELKAGGLDVEGPVPGDTVFVKLRAKCYDAVVAMYHDQGHIPVKLLGFTVDAATGQWTSLSGVNITLGLPIIRTSVDHGTAFDIAGQGIADARSLLDAIDYALQLGRGRTRA